MIQVEFHQGDIVSHHEWGVGLITEIDPNASLPVKIDFKGKPSHQMTIELARSNLTLMPSNGLEALFIKSPQILSRWSEAAPFKLIAAALIDFGKPTKPSILGSAIESKSLLNTNWEKWWKRVQPVIKESTMFRRDSKGAYSLTVPLEMIPDMPLPAPPPKKKKERITNQAAKDIAARVASGESNLAEIKGAEILKPVLRELLKKGIPSQQASDAFLKVTDGPVKNIRFVIDALVKSKRFANLTIVLEQIITQSRQSYERGEQDITKLGLVEYGVKKLVSHPLPSEIQGQFVVLTQRLLGFALDIWQSEATKWRSELIRDTLSPIPILVQDNRQMFIMLSDYLANHASATSSKIGISEELVKQVSSNQKEFLRDEIIAAGIRFHTQFAREYIIRAVIADNRAAWVLQFLERSFPGRSLQSLAEILKTGLQNLQPADREKSFEIIVALASAISLLRSQSYQSFQADVEYALEETLIKGISSVNRPEVGIIQSIMRIYDEKSKLANNRASVLLKEKESEIGSLNMKLDEMANKNVRQEEEIKRLQSGYRIPEKWAVFQGKKEISEGLAELYQDALLFKDASIDSGTRRWLLQHIEIMLQTRGISLMGKAGEKEKYDPAKHDFLLGTREITDYVEIIAPGFQLQDPNGNKIVLTRARVAGYGG
jgi:hypothetical protein